MADRIATHQQPPDANFLLHADLAEHGMPDAREQLWARQLDERRFAMRSLPFFTYGIALHDEVETDGTLTITRVVRSSGHRLLRVAVDWESAESFHGEFHPMLEAAELLHEWNGLGYVAVDLPPGCDAAELLAWLEARAAEGAVELGGGVGRPEAHGRPTGRSAAGRPSPGLDLEHDRPSPAGQRPAIGFPRSSTRPLPSTRN